MSKWLLADATVPDVCSWGRCFTNGYILIRKVQDKCWLGKGFLKYSKMQNSIICIFTYKWTSEDILELHFIVGRIGNVYVIHWRCRKTEAVEIFFKVLSSILRAAENVMLVQCVASITVWKFYDIIAVHLISYGQVLHNWYQQSMRATWYLLEVPFIELKWPNDLETQANIYYISGVINHCGAAGL